MTRAILLRAPLVLSLVALVVMPGVLVAAQDGGGPRGAIHFQRLSVEDGLSHPRVHCICQDRDGFMWFGTEDGLNRYDGHEVRVFRPKGWDPKMRYVVSSMVMDSDGILWLAELDTSFSKFDPATGQFLARYRYDPGKPEGVPYSTHLKIRGGPDDALWIGTTWAGLLRFDSRSEHFDRFPLNGSGDSTPPRTIMAVFPAKSDPRTVWLGTRLEGMVRLDVTTGNYHRYRDDKPGTHAVEPPQFVTFIAEGAEPGELWVGGDQARLFRFDSTEGRFLSVDRTEDTSYPSNPATRYLAGAVSDWEGGVWLASQNEGLAHIDPGTGTATWHRYLASDSASLGHNDLNAIYRDRRGVIWVATKRNGVSFFDPKGRWIRHHNLPDPKSLYASPVPAQAFFQEKGNADEVWIGSRIGLTRWNRQQHEFQNYRHDPIRKEDANRDAITCFSARREGGFWIGTQGGLSRYDPDLNRLIRVDPPPTAKGGDADFSRGAIRSIHEDRHGEVWIGLLPAGHRTPAVIRFAPATGEIHAYRHDPDDPSSIGPGQMTQMLEDRLGRLWFGSRMGGKGLSCFDRETGLFTRFVHDPDDPQSLPDDIAKTLHEDDREDVLWVGTRNGLARLDIGPDADLSKFETFSPASLQDETFGIEQDSSGSLWLATRGGLRRWARPGVTTPEPVLVAPETANRFQILNDPYCELDSGEILMGSLTGFIEIRPDQLIMGSPPPVGFSGITINGVSRHIPLAGASESGKLVVTHEQNKILQFQFAVLDFADPSRHLYSYRLEGLDEAWSPESRKNTAVYSTLPPGDYNLRVRASNARGVWNEEGVSLAFTVRPAWWETLWFRMVAVVLLAGAGGVILQLRHRAVNRRTRDIEAQLKIREALNEKLSVSDVRFQSFLANSSEHLWCIEFDEPISLDLPEAEQVERILDHGCYVEVNEAFAEAYGATVEEVIGWPLEQTLPREMPETTEFLLMVVRSGYRMSDAETVEVAKDGTERIILNNFSPTINEGKVVRVWGTARDVTDRRAVERAIALRSVALETMEDGCVIADVRTKDMPITYVNERFCQVTGYGRDEVIGRNCRFLQGEGTAPEVVCGIREALEAGETFHGEVLNYRKNGEPFWNLLRMSPVRDASGVVTHYVGVQTDVSNRKRRDQLIRDQRDEVARVSRVATMGAFTAAFAHELSQPLAASLLNVQAARRFLDREEVDREKLRMILDDAVAGEKRAEEILEGIRNLIRRDPGPRSQVDLNAVIHDSLKFLSDTVIGNLDLRLELDPDLPAVNGHAVQLQQVVINIITNASEAVTEPGGRGTLIIQSRSCPDETIEIRFLDDGSGMDESLLPRIFEPFFTTKSGGIGIGLSIDKSIIEAHNGRLWAENRPEGGALFGFSLPTEQRDHGDDSNSAPAGDSLHR